MQPTSRGKIRATLPVVNGRARRRMDGRDPRAHEPEHSSGSLDGRLDVLVRDFARFINSEGRNAVPAGRQGASHRLVISLVGGSRQSARRFCDPREGGFVGRASSLPRAAFVPLRPLLDPDLGGRAQEPAAEPCRRGPPSALATTEIVGELLGGFSRPPRGSRGSPCGPPDSYARLIALCVHDGGAPDGLLSAGPTAMRSTGCLFL